MKTLDEIRILEKNRKYLEMQAEVAEFYEENGQEMIDDMRFDRGVSHGMEGNFEGDTIRRNQAESDKYDPEILYGQPVKPIFERPGNDILDNVATQ